MKTINKIFVLFLLCIFLFNTMGYYIAFKIAQHQIKSEITSLINKGIADDLATIITIDKKEINNIRFSDNGKEISYKEQLYDIIKTEENKTTITYYCINDKNETTLYATLDEHINTHVATSTPAKNNTNKNIANDVVKIFYPNTFTFSFYNPTPYFYFPSINSIYTSAVIVANSPPPELV